MSFKSYVKKTAPLSFKPPTIRPSIRRYGPNFDITRDLKPGDSIYYISVRYGGRRSGVFTRYENEKAWAAWGDETLESGWMLARDCFLAASDGIE